GLPLPDLSLRTRSRRPVVGFGPNLTHPDLPRIRFAPLTAHGYDHEQWQTTYFHERESINAIADAAALHEKDAALSAQPSACQNADTFLLCCKYRRLHPISGLAQLDELCKARIGDVCDVAHFELA